MFYQMNTSTHFLGLAKSTLLLVVVLILAGCADALIYGENTNFSLASVKLNSNAAEPISVNSGLDRNIAVMAPAGANNEAVNMVAGFKLDHDEGLIDGKTGNGLFGTLKIRSEFASGAAGLDLASNHPGSAARIMNLSLTGSDSEELARRKDNMTGYLKANDDSPKMKNIAKRMGLPKDSGVDAIVTAVDESDGAEFATISAIVNDELPPF